MVQTPIRATGAAFTPALVPHLVPGPMSAALPGSVPRPAIVPALVSTPRPTSVPVPAPMPAVANPVPAYLVPSPMPTPTIPSAAVPVPTLLQSAAMPVPIAPPVQGFITPSPTLFSGELPHSAGGMFMGDGIVPLPSKLVTKIRNLEFVEMKDRTPSRELA